MAVNVERGLIQKDTSMGDGVVSVNGKQFIFQLLGMWRSPQPPRAGMAVDVTFDEAGVPVSLESVPDSKLAKEQAEMALTGAKRHGVAVAGTLKLRFGLPVIAGELVMLIAFFVMPNLSVGGGFGGQSFTGWDAIGFNVNTMSANDHGILSLLAIVGLLAPLAVTFVKNAWARWLFAAPLLFSILAVMTIVWEIESAGRTASNAAGDVFGSEVARQVSNSLGQMLHIGIGAYLVFLCAVFLATRALKAR